MASSNRNLYFAAIVSCLTAALFGYSVGFIGGEIVLPSFLSHFHLDHLTPHEIASARSLAVTSWIIGASIGVPAAMPICSSLGRRFCLQFAALLYVVGATAQVFSAGNLVVFLLGRLANGLGVGAGTLVSPIYISEISPASERGMLMSGYSVAVQSGAVIGFWGAYVCQAVIEDTSALQWQLPVAVQLIAGMILFLAAFLVPESPRYLAERGHYKPMEDALSWIRRLPPGDPRLTAELTEIEDAAELSEKLKRYSFFSETKKKDVRSRLHIGIGLMITQNMVGLNALNYYAPVIFMSAGFTSVSSSLFLTGIFGVVKFGTSLAFMCYFVRMRGNRFWLKLGTAVCGLAMVVLGYYVRLMPPPNISHEAKLTFGGIVSVLMVYLFAFSYGVSLGPISWNICSEIFPLHINAKCCAITTCTQWVFQIVIAAITPALLAEIGWGTYIVYAGFCAISYVWVSIFVPETRGVCLGKPMDELFGANALEDEEAIVEVSETTAFLVHDRRRRSSLAAFT